MKPRSQPPRAVQNLFLAFADLLEAETETNVVGALACLMEHGARTYGKDLAGDVLRARALIAGPEFLLGRLS